ncbi:MAG TPA: DUF423 domain-containing protein [Methylomirabilota bacterium]|nr:DUF423 domain-containing protein [Methylomirabilota bacterium]
MDRLFLGIGAAAAGLAVALGAFGAHLLRGRLTAEALATFEVGARYHMYHALALLAVALVGAHRPGSAAAAAGGLFVVGIVLFSGSLYGLALTGQRWLGAVTPFGGLAFLLGWAALIWAAARAG